MSESNREAVEAALEAYKTPDYLRQGGNVAMRFAIAAAIPHLAPKPRDDVMSKEAFDQQAGIDWYNQLIIDGNAKDELLAAKDAEIAALKARIAELEASK